MELVPPLTRNTDSVEVARPERVLWRAPGKIVAGAVGLAATHTDWLRSEAANPGASRDRLHPDFRRYMPRARSLLDSATIVLFAGALLAPAVDQCLRRDGDRDTRKAELRTVAPRPALPTSVGELAGFAQRYESYFDDTFGLRDVLLRWNSVEKWLALGLSPSS